MKTSLLEFLFNIATGLQFPVNLAKFFKNSFFHKTPSVAASEKFINFPGKHQWEVLRTVVDISYFHIT